MKSFKASFFFLEHNCNDDALNCSKASSNYGTIVGYYSISTASVIDEINTLANEISYLFIATYASFTMEGNTELSNIDSSSLLLQLSII